MSRAATGSNKSMTRSEIVSKRVKFAALVVVSSCFFANASIAETMVLRLPDAIRIALEDNIGLQRAAVQVDLDTNSLKAAKSDKKANLTLNGSENVTLDVPNANSGPNQSLIDRDSIWEDEGVWSDNLRMTLSSNVSLYEGGAIEASIREAEAALMASQNDYDRDRQALLLDTVTRFLEVIVREKQVLIREEELANQEEELERIRLNFRNGLRVRSEVLRQEALVAQSRGRLIEARRIHQNAMYILKDILKIPAGTIISCNDPGNTVTTVDDMPAPVMGASLSLLDQRLDLEAQRNRLVSARESVEVARAGKKISVIASANLNTSYSHTGKGGPFLDRLVRTEPSVSAGVSFSLPIFDRNRTETNILRSQLIMRREELIFENLEQVARTDLYQSFLNFESSQAQLVTAVEQLNSADEALKAEQARYETGLATLLDVNSIRSQRLDAAVSVEQARFDVFISRLSISFEDGTIEAFLLDNLNELQL